MREAIDQINKKVERILRATNNEDMDWSPGMERYMAGQINGLRQAIGIINEIRAQEALQGARK